MALTPFKVGRTLSQSGTTLVNLPLDITCDHYGVFQATITAGAVDHPVFLMLKQSKLVFMEITATEPCTIYTNAIHSGSPADTIPLTANQVIQWLGSGNNPVHSADVTELFVSVPGVTDCVLTIAYASNINV